MDDSRSVASAALEKAEILNWHPRHGTYPSMSSIPFCSPERIQLAIEDTPPGDDKKAPETVLYLAYGSNLSAETLLGMRKIRPLSRVNVSVPILRLSFDLPGVPYREPCFANVAFRKLPEKPDTHKANQSLGPSDPGYEWDGQLMGVVYEVTLKDWRKIMRTEGAGSSYREIVVPCLPIKSKAGVLGKPSYADMPETFPARTLYASDISDDGKDVTGNRKWLYYLARSRQRPNPGYAQASARYLKLLKDGAREHDLPEVYQKYLASLQPYTITRRRQNIGQFLFLGSWAPLLIFLLMTMGYLADESGQLPGWLAGAVAGLFNLMWTSYDAFYKNVFGDGERTEAEKQIKH